ncbi:hypothetical protein HDE_10447 [Halotydeus destructor]|nr:hypothetical protein HDE_10447 [Halotydeus destructor]
MVSIKLIAVLGVMAAMVAICQGCIPSKEEIEALGKDMKEYALKKMCTPIDKVKPGSCPPKGKKEWNWFFNNAWGYWGKLIKTECKKDLPDGWKADGEAVVEKCHKPNSNFCVKATQDAYKKCVSDEAQKLIPKYMGAAMGYCGCMGTIIKDFRTKHEPEAKRNIDMYDNWKINKAGC